MAKQPWLFRFSAGLAILAGGMIFLYAFLCMFAVPQLGMSFSPFDGEVFMVSRPETGLRPGDQVIAINGHPFADYSRGSRPSLPSLLGEKSSYEVTIVRGGETHQIGLPLQPAGFVVVIYRLIKIGPAFFFLYCSLILLLSMRPIDTEWFLGNTAFQLGSIIIAAGTAFGYNLFYSADVFRGLAWVAQPLFLQLSFFYPWPILRITQKVMIPLYLVFLGLAVAEEFNLLPPAAFAISLVITVLIAIVLLSIKSWGYPVNTGDNPSVVIALAFVVLSPLFSLIFTHRFDSPVTSSLYAYSLTLIPISAVYTVYRRFFTHVELRINRALSFFLFLVVLLAAILVLYGILQVIYTRAEVPLPGLVVFMILISAMAGAWVYPRFQRLAEVYIFKIPLLRDQLIHTYAGRIGTSLEAGRLSGVLSRELFPSILVRQAALLRLDDNGAATPFVLHHVTEDMLPSNDQLRELLEKQAHFLPPRRDKKPAQVEWVRLAIPLTVEGRAIGVALFGRRDPDDYYTPSEIPTLVSLMDQTALALYNIDQAQRLRQFHLANIERQETERKELARELHDYVLGEMALMVVQLPENEAYQKFYETYHSATGRIRSIVHGLRPTMIRFGLREAIFELASDLCAAVPDPPAIEIKLEEPDEKHPPQYTQEMEIHVFRIIQQACHNALLHGKARRITIRGTLKPELLEISVEDDGCGFHVGPNLEFDKMLENRHFGLAGMYERAVLIGANFQLHSTPGQGTRVEVHWAPGPSSSSEISRG